MLDHHTVKLTWFIDWPKKEVLFNVDDAFTDDNDWFSFGFSQRGQVEGSDVCFFVRNIYDESYNEAIVSKCKLCYRFSCLVFIDVIVVSWLLIFSTDFPIESFVLFYFFYSYSLDVRYVPVYTMIYV